MIRFENVSLRYGNGPEIFNNVNLHIARKSFQFLTGTSGAGKTSLIRLMFLSLPPSKGSIYAFGHDTRNLTRNGVHKIRQGIGVVFQDFRLLDHLTIYENTALPLRVRGRDEASYRSDVLELLDWVGLGEKINSLPPGLSGGEKQRAAIARAVITKPEILLADEPTGNVDPVLAQRLIRLFIELVRLGTSVVIASHDYELMSNIGGRRLTLENGGVTVYE